MVSQNHHTANELLHKMAGWNNLEYTVDVGCYNCHADITVSVSKGQLLDTVPCPKCGCKTLIPRK